MSIIQMHDRMLSDVLRDLDKAIEAEGIEFGEYGFGTTAGYRDFKLPDENWFAWQRVAVWPQVGSNEGWYIHIDLIDWHSSALTLAKMPVGRTPLEVPIYQRPTINLGLAKTWSWQSAMQITEAAGRLLGAAGNGTFARFALVPKAA